MDTKRLDLNLLVTLEALLVEQNVTRAAARLSLSQPAVSAQLNRLRELFDDPLLVAVHRGMYPTAKALELFEPLRKALNEVRATVAGHQDFEPASAELTVSIACTDYLQAALLIPLARELRKSAPGVRVAVRALDLHRLEAQLEQGDLDMALLTPPAAPSKLNSCRLFDEHYVLIGRRDHPSLKEGLSVEEYAALTTSSCPWTATASSPRYARWRRWACAATWPCPPRPSCLCRKWWRSPTLSRWCRSAWCKNAATR